ncbi:esterase/lipase family protein [Pseudomonas alkylphenolica]|uniref:esterase/lipase family protein n=1 Tax=Pseudomonas alkylphenolica TaxID=237609 RepID=UPI0018D83EF7|nr:alpha/beta hydrolase [Pseudomonas alkylphenolica]MBH3426178.1 alpha/beta hydrolase [Pseudomonas alkylphenolica]
MGTESAAAEKSVGLCSSEVVILIHGTFARDASWIDDDGVLAATIREKSKDIQVIPFRWSGINSPTARIKAGYDLAAVGEKLNKQGCRKIFLVAHSHGGNVALYSLRNLQMLKMVSGIWFLGTPFLTIFNRSVEKFSAIFTQTLSWLLLFPVFLPFGMMGLMDLIGSIFGPLAFAFMLFVGNQVLVISYLIIRPRLRSALHRQLTAILQRLQQNTRERLGQPEPKCPSVIAFVRWDEAGFLLRAIDSMAQAPWSLYGIAVQTVGFFAVWCIVTMSVRDYIYGDTISNLNADQLLLSAPLWVSFIVLVAPLVVAPLVSVIRGSRLAFGFEGVISAATLRIKPVAIPLWANSQNHQQIGCLPPKNLRGLRHSMFYADDGLITACAEWIAANRSFPFSEIQNSSSSQESTERTGVGRKNLVFCLVAAVMLGADLWLNSQEVKKMSEPVFDIEQPYIWFDVNQTSLTTVEINEVINGSGAIGYLSPKPLTLDPEIKLPPGAECVVIGSFSFGNWDSTVNVSLHNYNAPDFSYSSRDFNLPNRVKPNKIFVEDNLHREIVEWYSAHGASVTLMRNVRNEFYLPAGLFINLWNHGHDPVRIIGTFSFECKGD